MKEFNANEFVKLIAENPELPIVAIVDSECVADNGYSWWLAGVGTPRVDEYYSDDERIYLSEDFDDLVENFMSVNCDELPWVIMEDAEFEDEAEKAVSGYNWVKAIMLPIRP